MDIYYELLKASALGGLVSGLAVSLVWFFILGRKRDWSRVALKMTEVAPSVIDKCAQIANVLFDVAALQRGVRRESAKRAVVQQGARDLEAQ